jgi:hypothetical protein
MFVPVSILPSHNERVLHSSSIQLQVIDVKINSINKTSDDISDEKSACVV